MVCKSYNDTLQRCYESYHCYDISKNIKNILLLFLKKCWYDITSFRYIVQK